MKQYTCCICGYVHEGENPPEKCPRCCVPPHCFETFEGEHILKQISTDKTFINAMLQLKEKDPIEYQIKMQQFKNQLQQQEQLKLNPTQPSTQRKCRYCGSTSFTPVKRKWTPIMGFLTNKTDLVCNNCGKKVQWIDM